MKIEKIKINGTKMLELNYDLTKKTKMLIPSEVEGSIVKVNFKIFKDEIGSGDVDKILEKIQEKKPLKCFLGNMKTVLRDKARKEKEIPLHLTDQELVKEFVKKFASPDLQDAIVETALEIYDEARNSQ